MTEEGKGMVLRWQQMDCFALGPRWTRDYGNEVMCRTCLVDESRNGKTLLKTWTCVLWFVTHGTNRSNFSSTLSIDTYEVVELDPLVANSGSYLSVCNMNE